MNDPFRYRWLIFSVLGATYFFVWLHRVSTTVIVPDLMVALEIDAMAIGILSSSYFYLYAAVQPPVGILADTIGPRIVITVSTFTAFIGAVVFGTASNMIMATVGRALIGAGVGGVFVPALKTFSKWYRIKEFAGITGLLLAIGNIGTISASLPLTFLVLLLGWRQSFLTIGAASLLLAVTCWCVVRDTPEDKGWNISESTEGVSTFPSPTLPDGMNTPKRIGIVLKAASFWMVVSSLFFMGASMMTFQGLWAVPYLMDVQGYSRIQAGGLLMFIPVGFIIGAPFFGLISDKVASKRQVILICALGMGLISWTVFLIYDGSPPTPFLIPLFLLIGSSGGGSTSLGMTIMKELFPPWLTGTAVGLSNPSAFLGAAIFQPFTGFLMDLVGRSGFIYPVGAYHLVFITFFISMGIALASIVLMSYRGAKKENSHGE